MDLGNERTGGIEIEEVPPRRILRDRLRNSVRREDDRAAGFDLIELVDKDRAFLLEAPNHMTIVDDFIPDIDRRPVFLEGEFDDLDRTVDPGAEATGGCQEDFALLFHTYSVAPRCWLPSVDESKREKRLLVTRQALSS